MGKSISKDEYERAGAQLKGCRTKTCPNAGAKPDAADTVFCGSCKSAHRVVKDYERTRQ